jgi:hypothetical protein
VVLGAVIWIGVLVVGGRDGFRSTLGSPIGLAILLAPLVVAGVNLVLYRQSHEEVCRIEVGRHRSLRMIAGNGYSANTFAMTGVALIALAVLVLVLRPSS